jgi:hypothetical protein
MKNTYAIFSAAALAAVLILAPQPSLANCGNDKPVGNGCEAKGAPAPLIGVGLPGLAIGLGYGTYWLTRRRRSIR